jgi:hypothetical protein
MNTLKPSDFVMRPWDSVPQNTETEIVARNIMVISMRLGDEWGNVTRDQYIAERTKDGNYSEREGDILDGLYPQLNDVIGAIAFSPTWRDAAHAASGK